ncbi:hypothetical protein RRG08_027600 [Elysia crispata]|uniref:Uncharacterized protein n=1 Tax=Elysia crispata TaxID=231223 RepID=A0AAE1DYW2_9GAST|nr:hypothetical protein RRG08_027600 [Elysia crispata]
MVGAHLSGYTARFVRRSQQNQQKRQSEREEEATLRFITMFVAGLRLRLGACFAYRIHPASLLSRRDQQTAWLPLRQTEFKCSNNRC